MKQCGTILAIAWFTAGVAWAQYPYPPYPYVVPGPGDALRGEADVINATGNLFIQQEQARVQREVANQAKLDTKKKAFDQRLYEKALTQTYGETKAKSEAMVLKRVMTTPQEAEITSGKAHNTMLPFLNTLAMNGFSGPPGTLSPAMMKTINITGTGGANLGLLKDGGTKLQWPLACRGKTQKKLAEDLPKAVEAALDDSLDLKLYNDVSKGVEAVKSEVTVKFQKEEIDSGMYLEARRYLDSLASAVKGLRQPNIGAMMKDDTAATSRTIPELVSRMSQKGLKFAPATPGYDAGYWGLYGAMVYFGNGAMDSSAFKQQFAPLNLDTEYYEKSRKYGGK